MDFPFLQGRHCLLLWLETHDRGWLPGPRCDLLKIFCSLHPNDSWWCPRDPKVLVETQHFNGLRCFKHQPD